MKAKDLNEQELKFALDLVETLDQETQPINGHDDPGAITDRWIELRSRVQAMAEYIRSDWQDQAYFKEVFTSDDGVYRPFMYDLPNEEFTK